MRFTNDQIKRLSSIFDNIGQVILASAIFPVVLNSFDISFMPMLLWIIAMLVSWWISLRLERISS